MSDDRFYVLVIDDLADAADAAVELLSLWGYEATARYGGAAALDAARDRMPDAVVLDIGMPRMDGLAFAARFRRLPGAAAARVVAVTGHTSDECQARAREAGVDHYLLKPADPARLRDLLASLAGRRVLATRVVVPRRAARRTGPAMTPRARVGDFLTPAPVLLCRTGDHS